MFLQYESRRDVSRNFLKGERSIEKHALAGLTVEVSRYVHTNIDMDCCCVHNYDVHACAAYKC